MNWVKVTPLLLILSSLPVLACAQNAVLASTTVSAAERSLVREYLRRSVKPLDHEITTFNWRHALVAHNGADQLFSADDVRGYHFAIGAVPSFWKSFGTPNARAYGMYGAGLYLSNDPVATRSYGAPGDGGWILTQVRLPAKLKVFDTRLTSADSQIPVDVAVALGHMGCGDPEGMMSLDGFFGTEFMGEKSAACRIDIRKILDEELGMDAIVYSYRSTFFSDCGKPADANPWLNGSAFIVTNSRWMKPSLVSTFDSTTADVASSLNRQILQSVFLRHASEMGRPGVPEDSALFAGWMNVEIARNYPGFELANRIPDVHGSAMARIQRPSSGESREVAIPSINLYPYGPYVNSSTANPMQSTLQKNGYFLWPALSSAPVYPQIGIYLRENLFGCGPRPEFAPE